MKYKLINILVLFLNLYQGEVMEIKPNSLVAFLEGKWHTFTFSVRNGVPVSQGDYHETMEIKDQDTLVITAHALKDGEDVTKEMTLSLDGDIITMKQDDFTATGTKEGNVYYLTGNYGGAEYRFRLYTIGDKYVFHSEKWTAGILEQIDMSYLERE